MCKVKLMCCLVLLGSLLASPCGAADRFSAEFELYSGGITGDNIGAAYKSATRGDYGARFTFGFVRWFNLGLDYMYSNQSRSFTAVTPETAQLPQGNAVLRTHNLNLFLGNGEFYLVNKKKAKFYLSPGVGMARNGGRNMTLITPAGALWAPSVGAGRAVTFNLGAGIKVYPLKHLGFRFDVRDHVSGGGTGDLKNTLVTACPPGYACIPETPSLNAGQYFGNIPVQNNIVVTVGLIFRII